MSAGFIVVATSTLLIYLIGQVAKETTGAFDEHGTWLQDQLAWLGVPLAAITAASALLTGVLAEGGLIKGLEYAFGEIIGFAFAAVGTMILQSTVEYDMPISFVLALGGFIFAVSGAIKAYKSLGDKVLMSNAVLEAVTYGFLTFSLLSINAAMFDLLTSPYAAEM